MMKISIKNRKGKIIELEIDSNASVEDLMTKILQTKSTPIDQQHLIFDCLTLKKEKTLKEYCIQDGTTILLIKKKKSLLLRSSKLFVGSSLIDRIRQSYIDLEGQPPKEDTINLLIEAISYLDEKIDFNTTNELISLISSCFSNYPEDSFKIFQIRYQKPNISSLHLITLSSILSYFALNKPEISISNYNDFISTSIKEILPQVQNNIINIKVNGLEIQPEFKAKFITNLVLTTQLTEQIVSTLYSFFSLKEVDLKIINVFIQKVRDDRLLKYLPEAYFLENDLYLQISNENKLVFLTNISKESFKKILTTFEKSLKNSENDKEYSNAILDKCIEFNILPKSINYFVNNKTEFTSIQFWEFLDKNKVKFSDQFYIVSKIEKKGISVIDCYPKTACLLKIIPEPEKLPNEYLSFAFLNVKTIDVFESVFNETKNIKCNVFSTFEFWNNVLLIVSNSEKKCSDMLMNRFAFYFKNFVKIEQVSQLLNKLIFDNFPLNKKQSEFLFSMLLKLPKDYLYQFHSLTNDAFLITELLKQKKVPNPSFMNFFDINIINNKVFNSELKITPIILYELSFGCDKSYEYIKEVEIMPKNGEPNEILIKFIEEGNNFDLISDIDEESLSLIACALYLANCPKQVEVKGLTIENILPFYSILINQSDLNVHKTTKVMLDLLIESIEYLNKKPSRLLIVSINAIVDNVNVFSSKTFWAVRISCFFDSLCNCLLKGQYKADKLTLIKAIFKLTSKNPQSSIFTKNGMNLFDFIIQNIPEINKSEIFGKTFLNLNAFDRLKAPKVLIDIIQNSTSYEPIYQTIFFISKYVQFSSNLNFLNDYNIKTAIQKAIYENKMDEVEVIFDFMKKNQIKIDINYFKGKKVPTEIFQSFYARSKLNVGKIDDVIAFCLLDSQLEKNRDLLKFLFKSLMNDQFISTKYITICIEKITVNQVFSPDVLMKRYRFLNLLNKTSLIHVIIHYYQYAQEKRLFIRKISTKPLNLPEPDFQFMMRLVDQKSLQSFICLHDIASSFPFLFEPYQNEINMKHSLVVVNIVLPVLDHMSKIFDDHITPEKVDDIKISFAALSFLFSCLNSVRFLSIFTEWIFENLTKLSDSQIFCLSHVLLSLFKTEKVNRLIFAFAIKNNFFDVLGNLMNRKIENALFQQFYDSIIFDLCDSYLKLFSEIKIKANSLFIEQIKKRLLIRPFDNYFNNFLTILPIKIQPLKFTIPDEKNKLLNEAFNFFDYLNQEKHYWVSADHKSLTANEYEYLKPGVFYDKAVDNFLSSFKNEIKLFEEDDDLPSVYTKKITDQMHMFLLNQPCWAISYIENQFGSEILSKVPHYRNFFNDLIKKIDRLKVPPQKGKKIETFKRSIDAYKCFADDVFRDSFFESLLLKISNSFEFGNESIFQDLAKKFVLINDRFIIYLIQYISEYISKEQISSQILSGLCKMFITFWKKKSDIEKNFVEKCLDKLINVSLSVFCRTNENLLDNVVNILLSLKNPIPNTVIELIGLIFGHHPKLINSAIKLYLKIDEKDSSKIFSIVQTRYKKDVDEENIDFDRIETYINSFPLLAKSCFSTSDILLNKAMIKFKENGYVNKKLQDLIVSLFNKAAPDPVKTLNTTNEQEKEQISETSFLFHVPDYIKETSPIFWENFYEKNLESLNQIITSNPKIINDLTFLFDYKEILSFKSRYLCFKKNMADLFSYSYYNHNFIMRISKSRILLDSFGVWIGKRPKDFLSNYRIKLTEDGINYHLIQLKEWITYLMKEIFNPDLGLFLKGEDESYFFNPSTYLNYLNTECLKMAGGIIALSIINNIKIDFHLSNPLLKILLHQEIQLEDIKEFDENLFNSFQFILDSKDIKSFDLFFSFDLIKDNKLISVDLIKNGSNIEVNNENKIDYVNLYLNYKFNHTVNEQIKAFCEGFESFIDPKFIKLFSCKDLDSIICCKESIDFDKIKKRLKFVGKYKLDHPVIVMFLNVISKWTDDNVMKLFSVITASDNWMENDFPITISSNVGKDNFPFVNPADIQLFLPEYDNEEVMSDHLLLLAHSQDFIE